LGVAGIWLGVLNMQGNAGLWGNAVMHWDHLAFILLMAPALTVILVTGMLLYHGWTAFAPSHGAR
jgi:hypothetical protein